MIAQTDDSWPRRPDTATPAVIISYHKTWPDWWDQPGFEQLVKIIGQNRETANHIDQVMQQASRAMRISLQGVASAIADALHYITGQRDIERAAACLKELAKALAKERAASQQSDHEHQAESALVSQVEHQSPRAWYRQRDRYP